jgi:type VI secretion system secreted protein VgrG
VTVSGLGDNPLAIGSAPFWPEFDLSFAEGAFPRARVVEFAIDESVSGNSKAEVTVTLDEGLDLPDPIGQSATLRWWRPSNLAGGSRFCGVIREWSRQYPADGDHRASFTLTIQPALFCLAEEVTTRSFVGVSVLDLLREELAPALGRFNRELELRVPSDGDSRRPRFVPRPLCVQYAESTLDFFRRLLAEEGLSYTFDHRGERERLVITDGLQFDRLPSPVAFRPSGRSGWLDEAVVSLRRRRQLTAGAVSLAAFDQARPEVRWDDEGRAARPETGPHRGEAVVYRPGATATVVTEVAGSGITDVARRAECAADRLAIEAEGIDGRGDVMALRAGELFRVAPRPGDLSRDDRDLLVERALHRGRAPDGTTSQGQGTSYEVEFHARFAKGAYRPAPLPKPVAVEDWGIVRTANDAIETDALGRVQVQFLYDIDGESRKRFAWVPVSQAWVGAGFGTQVLPRAGMLVRVEYSFGDPERPVIADCFPTARNALPAALPAKSSRLTLRSRSLRDPSQAAAHHNEFALDDAAEAEELFVRAGRNFRRVVKRNEATSVGGNERRDVTGPQEITVSGVRQLIVGGQAADVVRRDRRTTVEGESEHRVLKNQQGSGGRLHERVDGASELAAEMMREEEITGVETQKLADRTTRVLAGSDELHVSSTRRARGDKAVFVSQGKTALTMRDGKVQLRVDDELVTDNPAAKLGMKAETPTHLLAKKLRIICGSTQITLGDDGINVRGPQVLVRGAAGSIELGAVGATVSGDEVTASAVVLNEVKGPVVIVREGSASLPPGAVKVDVAGKAFSALTGEGRPDEGPPRTLEAVLWGRDGKPATNIAYRIRLPDGRVLSGTTDGKGGLSESIPAGISVVAVAYKPSADEDETVVALEFPPDGGSPAERARAYLRNLGYVEVGTEEEDAVRAFQRDAKLPLTGELDEATTAALEQRQAGAGGRT